MYASPLKTPLIRTGKYGLRGVVTTDSGKASANHEGVDCRAAVGTPVYATIGGTVVQTITGWASASKPGRSTGRAIFRPGMGGNQVVYRGDDGRDHNDGHLQSVAVKVGQRVEVGTLLGASGTSGGVAPHLHHGIWIEYAPNRWRSIDPTPLLPWDGDKFGELAITSKASALVDEGELSMADIQELKLHVEHVTRLQAEATRAHVTAETDRIIDRMLGAISAEGGRLKAHMEHVARTHAGTTVGATDPAAVADLLAARLAD
jgi:hypothetical protein